MEKNLADLRYECGYFVYPAPDEMHAIVARINALVEQAFDGLDVEGFRARFVQAAQDLAGQALSDAEGYARKVQTFTDLTRAELAYVEAQVVTGQVTAGAGGE